MQSDTTTLDGPYEPENPAEGTVYRIGLKNGQTLMFLTEEPRRVDGACFVYHAANGETIDVVISEIAYIRSYTTAMPTEEEIAAYEEKLKTATGLDAAATSFVNVGGTYL